MKWKKEIRTSEEAQEYLYEVTRHMKGIFNDAIVDMIINQDKNFILIGRGIQRALAFHVGTMEKLLVEFAKYKSKVKAGELLIQDRNTYIKKGYEHAEHHLDDACPTCTEELENDADCVKH